VLLFRSSLMIMWGIREDPAEEVGGKKDATFSASARLGFSERDAK
jgi:hypothetical protein